MAGRRGKLERRKIFALGLAVGILALCVSVTAFYTASVPVAAEADGEAEGGEGVAEGRAEGAEGGEGEVREGQEEIQTHAPLTLKIFHAGSLAVPLKEAEKEFEALNPNVDVRRESMGSIAAIRQVTDVGKQGDVVVSADYTLIPEMMYPEYADWVVRFATNDLVLAYNPEQGKSRFADEITADNWYEILRRDGVVFGFSNPNLDPCGYRAVMVCQLAELHYGDAWIFDDLILNNTAITVSEEREEDKKKVLDEERVFLIRTPEDLQPKTEKVCIRPKSVELVALVEAGGLDYAFEYRSVAVQHNLAFVDLPEPVDLSSVEFADEYKKVRLKTADGKTKTGKPIVYGITVPKDAYSENPELGLEFVKFLVGEAGQRIFEEQGQPPLVPAVGSAVGSGNLPEELRGLVVLKTAELESAELPTATPPTTPTPATPGFEAVFAVAGWLAVADAYLLLRKK